ncbi:helix-turn-helix transcriptional regulator [Bradyrhizobium sp. SZCCHNR2032]|uniref:S24 family peptidase n=1 Tax=Bradyrhizobium sp. SZCCHNR2032 TaxID=3057384 RepID=UPI0029167A8E|nr:S24 family peptidase [Bradyrhizobium sp. SZCCHNR2032]
MDAVRKLILDKLSELRLTRADVSKRLGRNATYLQQFLTKGSPRELPERERHVLAEIFHIPEEQLRGPSLTSKPHTYAKSEQQTPTRESIVDTNARPPNSIGVPLIIPGGELYAGMDLPVYGTAQAGDDGELVISDRPVDYVARPSVLLRVQDAYGTIVTGDSMFPAVKNGATALVNPHQPPRIEDICVFRSHADDGGVHILIKEYRGQTESHWKVRQYNPPKDFTLKKSEWQVCQRVVGNYAP